MVIDSVFGHDLPLILKKSIEINFLTIILVISKTVNLKLIPKLTGKNVISSLKYTNKVRICLVTSNLGYYEIPMYIISKK